MSIKQVPLLHKAIIRNEDPHRFSIKQVLLHKTEKGPEGLTAIDLAYMLNNQQWLKYLSCPTPPLFFHNEKLVFTPSICFQSYSQLRRVQYWIQKNLTIQDTKTIWMKNLYSRELNAYSYAKLTVKKLPAPLNLALFADEPLKKGTFITEYAGEIIHHWRLLFSSNEYLWEYSDNILASSPYQINAKYKGNFSRFINHSDSPNCIPCFTVVNHLLRIFFIALKDISKNEQITVHYGPRYWKKRKKISN